MKEMDNQNNQTISICLPIYNEAESIVMVIQEWLDLMKELSLDFKIICSEDGSTDGTKEIIKELCKKNSKIIDNTTNEKRGYTKAVISGVRIAKSEYILCIDSDGQCDPKDFKYFWENRKKLEQNYFVIGNRFNRKDGIFRLIISKTFKVFHKILFYNSLSDPSCPYVFFQKKNFNLIENKLHYTQEGFWWGFVGACILNNFKFHEIKINHRKRLKGNTNVYKLHKIPLIALKNALGLIKLRFNL